MMHAEKVSFRHAVELLSNGTVGKAASGGTKAANVRRLESPIQTTAADHELLGQIADYYHSRLKQSPDALAYLQKRFITDPEAIERFKIGFSDRTLGLTLPVKQTKSGAEIRERLQRLGVMKETGHELMRGCVTFPVPVVGGVGEIYGRRIDPKTPRNMRHWYLSGSHAGVWNIEAFTACDELILCESIIDALTFWCAGFRNVTTIYGTNGLTGDMIEAIKTHEIKRLLIALDADEAGDNATSRLTH
jgi:DNA primase